VSCHDVQHVLEYNGGHLTLIGQKCAQIGIITCSSSLVLHDLKLHNLTSRVVSMAPSSRKRKRGLSDAKKPDSLSIELSSLPETQIGPALGVCVVILEQALRSLLI
jgi:hypothetical protein